MTRTDDPKRILFISLKKEAEPLLGELRAAGHRVSIVDELEDARTMLASGAFDQAVIPGHTLGQLLVQHSLWQQAGGDSWRRSTLGLAHDLRKLLQALEQCTRGIADLQLTGLAEQAELLDVLRSISTLSVFLLELTDELDAEGTPDLNVAALDLEDAVEAAAVAVYPSAAERRQRLVIDIDEDARCIEADPTRVKRALSHLLAYASRQSPSRGTVTVRARRESDDCVIATSYTAETVSLSGFADLLGPASGERAGSGLYQVQNIIEQHGGRLWLESQRGTGTSVFLALPLAGVAKTRSQLSLTPG